MNFDKIMSVCTLFCLADDRTSYKVSLHMIK